MVEIVWTEPALSDLDAIADFIALENPVAAQKRHSLPLNAFYRSWVCALDCRRLNRTASGSRSEFEARSGFQFA